MRHFMKLVVHILRALAGANPVFCMALLAILAIGLAAFTINALVTLATLAAHGPLELAERALGLPPSSAIFIVCLAALLVVWKALDVVADSCRRTKRY
ncbi:MAG TPA: hypothetical protein VMU52_09900 [Steroidobacteraceae bacterium]|nr:hypothetical protein [Steroidobacteraceae bacterium]